MRVIRFRARSLRTGKWVYGDYMSRWRGEDKGTIHYIVEHPYGEDAGREVLHAVDPETLGQFTGVKDREGRDIYEQDQVRVYARSKGASRRDEEVIGTRTIRWGTIKTLVDEATGFRVAKGGTPYYLVIGNTIDRDDEEASL